LKIGVFVSERVLYVTTGAYGNAANTGATGQALPLDTVMFSISVGANGFATFATAYKAWQDGFTLIIIGQFTHLYVGNFIGWVVSPSKTAWLSACWLF
jgi:hypothetical protein